jgi:6-phosphogluconolactonase
MSVARSLFVIALALSPTIQPGTSPREWIVYVGTYTGRNSKGIYAYRFEAATGKLTPLGLAGEIGSPSFLAVHPNQRFLYAVGETAAGTVSSFSIDRVTGMLKLLNTVPSQGSGPCHVEFDRTGKWLFVANYNSGSIAALPVHEDGRLGEAATFVQHSGASADPQRQAGPHAHSVNISPDNRFLLVADLGLDEVLTYKFDATRGALIRNNPPFAKIAAGSGPRHLAFGPDEKFVYLLSEMKATVTTMAYNKSHGTLTGIQTLSTLPNDLSGPKSGAEIAVHPNGKFLYASNRGHESIAIFDIDPKKGTLTSGTWVATRGKSPRHFAIDPTGTFLFAANQDSNNVVVFRIDPKTGGLTPTGDVLEVGSPVCVVFAAVQ